MNVIGYKGTELERHQYWLTMQTLKGSIELFKDRPGAQEQKVVEQDRRIYSKFLSRYVA